MRRDSSIRQERISKGLRLLSRVCGSMEDREEVMYTLYGSLKVTNMRVTEGDQKLPSGCLALSVTVAKLRVFCPTQRKGADCGICICR